MIHARVSFQRLSIKIDFPGDSRSRQCHSNARGVLFLWCGALSTRDGVSFLRDRHNDSGAAARRGGIVRGLQEGASVEWDIWSHRAIQQSLASAAHTNGWYRAATPSTARSSRAGFFLRLFFLPMPRQDVNQWDAEKRKIHAPFRAPCSSVLFPSTLLARISPECLSPFFSPRVPRFSSPPATASVSSFYLVGCRGAQRHGKKESGIGPLLSSRSLLLSFSFLLCRSRALLHPAVAAVRWFVNAKFKLSHAALLEPLRRQWRYQHIHSFQIPPRAILRNAETSIPMRQETREKGEERRTPVSRGFCCHCERIFPVAVQIKSWLSMKFETLAYDLSSPICRFFITHFLFDKTSLLALFYASCSFCIFLNLIYDARERGDYKFYKNHRLVSHKSIGHYFCL